MIIVITGSNGFTASYLSKYIKSVNPDIIICGLDISLQSYNLQIDKYFSKDELHSLVEYLTLMNEEFKVFHLAGLLKSNSFEKLLEANVLATAKYVESFRRLNNLQMFINIGSSAEYGIQEKKYLNEILLPNPVNPYGLSKSLQSKLVLHLAKIYQFNAISTITFNLIGPGLSENLVVGRLVNEFLKIKNGDKEFCEIGRTNSIRNFIDVRDAVKIYWELSQTTESNTIFNVGHPKSYSIVDVLKILSEIIGINPTLKNIHNSVPQFDIDYQYPDLRKTELSIGNFTYYSIEESLIDMVNFSVSMNKKT